MNEVTIEIRDTTISIGANGIKNDQEEAKKILRAALNALETTPKSVHGNELVYEKK